MEFEPENTKEVGEETLLQENMDPKLLFENAENEKKMKKPTDELNEFYCSKNTSVFASKVGRFQSIG